MTKQLLTVVVLGLSELSINAAMAHGGAQSPHGGVATTGNEQGLELLTMPVGAEICVVDHGKPMTTPIGLRCTVK